MPPTLSCATCRNCAPIDLWTSTPTDACPCNAEPFHHFSDFCNQYQPRPTPQPKPDRKPAP